MLTDNGRSLENSVLVSLPGDRAPDEAAVGELATRLRAAFPVSEDEYQEIIRRLHSKLAIQMDMGIALTSETYIPWLFAKKASIDPFYWQRFRNFLHRLEWPPRVVSTLDRVTDEVLDLLQDPVKDAPWKRRGLVIGDVQSGKTATYTALCCKAADAGYRLIILLTGTLESLRRQTQERLDEGFVGLDSSGLLTQIRKNRAVGVGLIDSRRAAGVFTSREKDFSRNLLNALGFRLDAFKEPVLVVVKKNKRILENLEKWLSDFNANQHGKIDAPLLLIDDEADSASVNTNPTGVDPTAINRQIRALLRLFTRSSYIGFTATPFANIFIDPDTDHEMLGDDLFPRDFIYTLDPPTNYLGPEALFGEQPRLDILRTIDDAYNVFPLRHKSDLKVESLPETLVSSLFSFLLANAIRDLRGEGPTHRSMLVNVSRFTAVQDQVAVLIHEILAGIQQDIRNYSQLTPQEALNNSTIARAQETWKREYTDAGFAWREIQRSLLNSVLPITVKAINQRTGAASLDYALHKNAGLRVIAVGGNSLSRGLTLEGLSTSYFFRNSQMYDTLLQMGRWFGYRDGYADLCRLWITDEGAQWYSHITSATEELRDEVKRMRQEHATPMDFGLKVRGHPDSLLVTAQNKMRQAKTIERVISLSCQLLETVRLRSNSNSLISNRNALTRFIDELQRAGFRPEKSHWDNTIWRDVPKEHVAAFLRDFDVHPLNVAFQTGDLARYLENTSEPKLRTWDVVIPNGSGKEMTIGPVTLRTPKRYIVVRDGMLLVGKKARVGSRGSEKEGLDVAEVRRIEDEFKRSNPPDKSISDRNYRAERARPLLLCYVLSPNEPNPTTSDEIVAMGLSFPKFDDMDVAKRVKYRVNLVEWRSMLEEEIDDDLQEEEEDVR
ncbi:MAG TPA: Z1 domain-containing protein [Terriglobia bacterium]|nr:Z1 domain-containing protein [Terriglobia bacterium]